MTTFLARILSGLGGAIAGVIGYKPNHMYDVAPWRNPRWRVAVSKVLGEDTPADSPFLTEWFYDYRLQLIGQQPEAVRTAAIVELNRERLESWENDSEWAAGTIIIMGSCSDRLNGTRLSMWKEGSASI